MAIATNDAILMAPSCLYTGGWEPWGSPMASTPLGWAQMGVIRGSGGAQMGSGWGRGRADQLI